MEIKKIHVIKDPLIWTSIDKKEFISNIINRFSTEYRVKTPIPSNKKFSPFPYQQFLKIFMSYESPYRGIYLFHGLGSGKTCSAIQIAEANPLNHTIVLLPASLKENFRESIHYCGSGDESKYTTISYNSSQALLKLKEFENLDNKTIIVDEAHKLVSMMINEGKQGKQIYELLMNAKNSKIVFLSGTPIVNRAYEMAIFTNILRGYIELTILEITDADVTEYGPNWNIVSSFEHLMKLKYIDHINQQGKQLYVHINIPSYVDKHSKVVDEILGMAELVKIRLRFKSVSKYTLFPEDEDEFDKYFIKMNGDIPELIRIDVLKRRMMGLISYYRGADPSVYPKLNEPEFVKVEMSGFQFREYKDIRLREKEKERPSVKGKTKMKSYKDMKQVSSTFRIYSREFSNFVFPAEIPRPTKSGFIINTILRKNNTKIELDESEEIITSVTSKDYIRKIDKSLDNLRANRDKYLSKTALRQYSPKFLEILNRIEKEEGLILVYSDFRKMEGIGIFAEVLETNGFSGKYAFYSGLEDPKERDETIRRFTSVENKNGELIKILLITSAGTTGLDLKNIRFVHIIEPYWNESVIKQVIGRAMRINSHIDLPPNNRTVTVYRYMSVFDNLQLRDIGEISTDEYIYDISMKKEGINEEIVEYMKETAIDCVINSLNNEPINCFIPEGVGLSYMANIAKNMTYNRSKRLIDAGLTNNGKIVIADKKARKLYYTNGSLATNPKIVRKIAYNKQTAIAYNYNQAKKGFLSKI